jgi:hypothetical protein
MKRIFAFTLLFSLAFASFAKIIVQPRDTSICENGNIIFNIKVINPNYSFQWQQWTGSKWTNLIGTNNDTFFINSVSYSLNGVLFRCKVDSSSVPIDSSSFAKLTVLQLSIAPSTISTTVNPIFCSGGSTSLSVSGGFLGFGASWKWYTGSCGGTIVGTGATLSVNPSVTTTYFVRAEGNCNTTACASVTVTVTNTISIIPSSANASVNPISCPSGSTTLSISGGSLGSGASWFWYSGSCGGSFVGTGNSLTVSPLTATSYFVRAEGTCNTTACVSVSVLVTNSNSVAPTSVTASINPTCQNQTTTLSFSGGSLGSGASWKWYAGSCGGTLIGTGTTLTVNPSITTTYFVRAEGTCNVTSCVSLTVSVTNTSSTSAFSVSASVNPVSCPGASTSLTVSGGGLGSGASWKWYSGSCGGTYEGNGTTLSINPSSTTNYFVRAEGTCNTTSCVSTMVIVSNSNSTNPSSITASVNPISCPGNSTLLSVIGGTLGSGASWKWYSGSCGGTLIGSGITLSVNPQTSTTYFVRAEGICNTTSCVSITITVSNTNSTPPTGATGNSINCPGMSTTISVSGGTLGTGGASWKWYSGSCGGTYEGTGSSLNVNPLLTTTYFVRAEGPCNITACASITINVANSNSISPTGITAGLNPICLGQTTSLTVTGGSLGTGAKWKWYNSCGGNAIDSGVTINIAPIGGTTYFVRAVGTCNTTTCGLNLVLGVNKLPNVNAGNDISICTGSSTTLSTSYSATNLYSWNPTIGINDPFKNSTKANPNATTTYIIKVVDINNCSNSDTIKVLVNPLPSINAGSDTAICKGDSAELNASNGGIKYKWIPFDGLNSSTISNPKASPLITTKYNVIITDANGCENSDDLKVVVNPRPVANSGNDAFVCIGSSTQLNSSGGIYYNWSPTTGLDFPNTSNPKASPLNSVTYKVIVGNIYGCTDTSSVIIIVNPLPNAYAGIDDSICIGGSTNLTASGGVLFSWSPSVGLNKTDISSVIANPVISSIYKVIVTDTNGCSMSDDVKVIVNPLPNANAGQDVLICRGTKTTLMATGGVGYSWTPSSSLDNSKIQNPKANPTKSQTYIVSVMDKNGCKNIDSVSVNIVANPLPVFTYIDSSVCKNAYWAQYCVAPTANKFSWKINNKDSEILTGQGTNCIKVHWPKNATNGLITLIEKLKINPFCSDSISFNVKITNGVAPDQATIIAKANNINTKILICRSCNYKSYEWGYEEKISYPKEIITCKGTTWCSYDNIDTFRYNYWVKVGNDSCLTKSYFNYPRLLNDVKRYDLNGISLFPNPTTGMVNIESNMRIYGLEIYNLLGERINNISIQNTNNIYSTNLTEMAKGIYIVRISTSRGLFIKKILKE